MNETTASQTGPDGGPQLRAGLWSVVWLRLGWLMALWRNPWVTGTISLLVFAIALQVIGHELTTTSGEMVESAVAGIGPLTVLGAALMVAVSYAGLSLNDRYALKMLGRSVSMRRTVRASLTAYGLAKGLGYSWATASTARHRLYRRWGLDPLEIGALSTITGVAVPLAAVTVAGLGLALGGAVALDGAARLPFEVWMLVALVCLMPAAFYVSYLAVGPRTLKLGPTPVSMLSSRAGISHLGAVMLDRMGAATALFLLLPDHGGWTWPAFLSVFVLAGFLGALSGAPGGLGVFEAVILALAPVSQDAPGAAVALLVYRLLYTVIPLALALAILTLEQAAPAIGPARSVVMRIGSDVPGQAHRLLAIAVFGAGLAVLLSVATPAVRFRLDLLERGDLGLVSDLAHLGAALLSVAIMAYAGALWRDIAGSWQRIVWLLIAGSLACCLKGLDWEEALLLALVAVAVVCLRGLLDSPRHDARGRVRAAITVRWWYLVAGSLVAAVTLAAFAHPQLSNLLDLPRLLVSDAEAGRVARALLACGVLLAGLGLAARAGALNAADLPLVAVPELDELARKQALAGAPRPDWQLAHLDGWSALADPSSGAVATFCQQSGRLLVWGLSLPSEDRNQEQSVWPEGLFGVLTQHAADQGCALIFTGCPASLATALSAKGFAIQPLHVAATITLLDELPDSSAKRGRPDRRFVLVPCQSERFDRIVADCPWLEAPRKAGWFGDLAALQVADDGTLEQVYPIWFERRGPPGSRAALVPRVFFDPALGHARFLDQVSLGALLAVLRKAGVARVSLAAADSGDRFPLGLSDQWVEDNGLSPIAPITSRLVLGGLQPGVVTIAAVSLALEAGSASLTLLDLAGVIGHVAPPAPTPASHAG